MEPDGIALAIDIGGTKAAVGRVTPDGTVLARAEVPTGTTGDPFPAIAAMVRAMAVGDEVVCGVGSAGPLTDDGTRVSPVNGPSWVDFPLAARLAAVTGLATFVDIDTKALALGEGHFGAARGVDDYLAMVVSTGIGGGIVSRGQLLEGATGNAGHIGHVVVEPDGRRCGCGGRGCLEAQASGTAILAATGRPPADATDEVRAQVGRWVGIAVASVANLLDLRLAVVAGSVALGYGEPFFAAAQAEIDARSRLTFSIGTRIVPTTLDDAPLLGAACVGWRGAARQ
jgi:glucokinase